MFRNLDIFNYIVILLVIVIIMLGVDSCSRFIFQDDELAAIRAIGIQCKKL